MRTIHEGADKPTLATLKSFIRKNRPNLLIKCRSEFDGMTDCVQNNAGATFEPAQDADRAFTNNLGIAGVWIVFRSRDYINPLAEPGYKGFRVYNCCGSFEVAVRD